MKINHVKISCADALVERTHSKPRITAGRLIGASLASMLVGLVGFEIVRTVRTAKFRKHLENRLDSALEDSMDCMRRDRKVLAGYKMPFGGITVISSTALSAGSSMSQVKVSAMADGGIMSAGFGPQSAELKRLKRENATLVTRTP